MIQDMVDVEENAEIDQLAETEDGEDDATAGARCFIPSFSHYC